MTKRDFEPIAKMLDSFISDPPDTDFQSGYLQCLLDLKRDFLMPNHSRLTDLEQEMLEALKAINDSPSTKLLHSLRKKIRDVIAKAEREEVQP